MSHKNHVLVEILKERLDRIQETICGIRTSQSKNRIPDGLSASRQPELLRAMFVRGYCPWR